MLRMLHTYICGDPRPASTATSLPCQGDEVAAGILSLKRLTRRLLQTVEPSSRVHLRRPAWPRLDVGSGFLWSACTPSTISSLDSVQVERSGSQTAPDAVQRAGVGPSSRAWRRSDGEGHCSHHGIPFPKV